jgi:hypothetical protein
MFLFFFQGQISFWPKKVGVPFWPSKISMLPNGLGSFYSFFTITVARVRVCLFFFHSVAMTRRNYPALFFQNTPFIYVAPVSLPLSRSEISAATERRQIVRAANGSSHIGFSQWKQPH